MGDLDAIGRLIKFCDEWNKMRHTGDEVQAIHMGDDRHAYLRISDIRQAADEIARLRKRLEVVEDWSEDADGIACRNDTIRLQDERIARLREEVSYLLDRSCEAGRCRFGGKRWTGMSSNAINAVAFGRDDPGDMPYDSADLAACYEMIKRLPKHLLTETLSARLNEAEEFVSQGYPDALYVARACAEWPGFAALQHKEPQG